MLAFLTALFGAPAAIATLLDRVSKLEALVADLNKEREVQSIDQATHDSQNAETSDDVKKAAHEASEVTSHL